jgi:hypothetical protein
MCKNHFPTEYIIYIKDQFGKLEVKYKKCENCGSYDTDKDEILHDMVEMYRLNQNVIETTPIEKRRKLKELCDAQNKVVKTIRKRQSL